MGKKRRKKKRKNWIEPRPPRRHTGAALDELVDRFVAAVNGGYREPVIVDIDSTPPSVRVDEPDEDGFCDWAIKPYAGIDWVDSVERKVPRRFPTVYRSLISRYIFPAFEAGDVFFFANTPEGTESYELRTRIFSEDLAPVLQGSGYIEIGKPGGGGHDPICFVPDSKDDDDRPLVRIDHEGILMDEVIEITDEVAPSLSHLMTAVIEAADSQPGAG